MEALLEAPDRVNSTHQVEVVRVRLEPHPNADRLSVVRVYGYQVCTASAEWRERPPAGTDPETGESYWLGAYVPPDSLVDVSVPAFAFLAPKAKSDGKARIKAVRLRGVQSFGLLVPAPGGAAEGDDVADVLKVEHYEPPLPGEAGSPGDRLFAGAESASAPAVDPPKYDLEAFRRHHAAFAPGERVVVTEKLDGCLRADQKVLMADGTEKPIGEVSVGDNVKSYNLEGRFEDKPVVNTYRKPTGGAWVRILFDNGRELVCTIEHPILTTRGWMSAGLLGEGDDIVGV